MDKFSDFTFRGVVIKAEKDQRRAASSCNAFYIVCY